MWDESSGRHASGHLIFPAISPTTGQASRFAQFRTSSRYNGASDSRGGIMPFVQITWLAGRTPEQKRKLAERVTQALIEDGRAKREHIQVTFVDLPHTDYAEGGVIVADQKRNP
jgi:4-oxalocrotonate tautomerase